MANALRTAVGTFPQYLAVNPNTGNVYVANPGSASVSVISGSTNQVIATVPVGKDPEGVAVNPNTGKAYTANNDDNTVSVISSNNQVTDTISVGRSRGGGGVEATCNAALDKLVEEKEKVNPSFTIAPCFKQ